MTDPRAPRDFVREIVKAAQKVESSAVILPHHKKQLTEAILGTDFSLPELIQATKTEAADWINDPYRCGQAGNLLVSKLVNHALIAREDKQKELATQRMLVESTAREQAKAEEDRAEAARKAAETESLIEDELPSPDALLPMHADGIEQIRSEDTGVGLYGRQTNMSHEDLPDQDETLIPELTARGSR